MARYEVRRDQTGAGWVVWDTTRNGLVFNTWDRFESGPARTAAALNRESQRWETDRFYDREQIEAHNAS